MQASDPIRRLSTSQSPVFLVNSRYPLLSAARIRSRSESLHELRHTLSRSYGVNLPSSLTRVLPSALAFSARPPESVSGTVTRHPPYEAFLGSMGSSTWRTEVRSVSPLGVDGDADFPTSPAYRLSPPSNRWLDYPSPSPLRSNGYLMVREY